MSTAILDLPGFTIIKKLGTGARTTIYLATDDETGRQVALKRAVLERAEDVRIFEQMEAEYRVARDIDHQYLRKCYKIIKKRKMLKVSELFLSMEYFEGKSLEEGTTLSLIDVMAVFKMVAIGLNAMHQHGYVHCDIKPNNILISKEGYIRIIDLGQSCKIGTIKERIQGTPDYIAPEQVKKQQITHKTDIFNLGATMYWALTGRNVPTLIPQKSDLGMISSGPKEVLTPNEYHRRIPMGLSNLVMECVKESPADRPSSMTDLISRLDLLMQSILGNKRKNAAASD